METSVYKVITVIGSSPESWEKAAAAVIEQASKSLQDLRIAEVETLDMQIDGGKIIAYRARIKLSFKYHGKE
jgi:dodecin